MRRADVDVFEKIVGQLESVYDAISLLSKKSPNDGLNKFKLKFINRLLEQSNVFLGDEYQPFEDFSVFDEDDVPQNSDVVFILSQYLQCFEKLRADNCGVNYGNWQWELEPDEGEEGDERGLVYIATVMPKRLREKK